MKRLYVLILGLLLLIPLQGQILRYSNYTAPAPPAEEYPSVLDDGHTVGFYISSTGVTKDGSDYVSLWADQSLAGNDLVNSTGGEQPLWSSNGITFDGTNDILYKTFNYAQPGTIYMVIQWLTFNAYDRILSDGAGEFYFRMNNGTPELNMYSGTAMGSNTDLAEDTWGIITLVVSNTNSKIQINEGTPVTGTTGTNNISSNTLFLGGSGAYAHFQIKELIFRDIDDTSDNELLVINYLNGKYTIY
jgi:hypothetical protein